MKEHDFRAEFYSRLRGPSGAHGKRAKLGRITKAANAIGANPDSLSRWNKKDGGFPDIWEAYLIAQALGEPAGWLFFNEGPAPLSDRDRMMLAELNRLSPEQQATVRALIVQMLPKEMKIVPVEKKPMAVNRRDEIPVYTIRRGSTATAKPIPQWLKVAAGPGQELELSEDVIWVEELKHMPGVHACVVKGDSMIETVVPGDVILMQEYPEGRMVLPSIESAEEKNTLFKIRSLVPDDHIYILSVDREAPTLKRVHYDVSSGERNWYMQIVPDNRMYRTKTVSKQNEVVFHARLIGRGEFAKEG